MIRRFNYTGRIKIARSRVNISMFKDADGKYFKAKINLDGLNFPPSAKIYIEPNYKGIYQRFNFGTVENCFAPLDTGLNELPNTEIVYFDVLVVDEESKVGLLLGKAKGIVVSTDGMPSDRIPLLPVNPTDLRHQFWKLSFDSSDAGSPVLEINKNIPNVMDLIRNDNNFISLVLPAAFRGVLIKIIEKGDFDSEEDSWNNLWIKFIDLQLGIKNLPQFDDEASDLTAEQEAWIDDCVNEYCKKMRLFEKYTDQFDRVIVA